MNHLVLLGDSIFDNARYVAGGQAVIDQLNRMLPSVWTATLLARDGSGTSEMGRQLERLPPDASHLVVSCGGNDALDHSGFLLRTPAQSFAEVLATLGDIQSQFQHDYRKMLQAILAHGKPTIICTVYDSVPGLDVVERVGLCLFNDVILREGIRSELPVIDLRLICTEAGDYSESSPIEPSAAGGGKIARAISRVLTSHDFLPGGSRVFS